MTGVLDGIEVLDLSSGIGGPMAGMLLADHGARVTMIEPPAGDASRSSSGAASSGKQVWNRGKRSAVLDLHDPVDRDRLYALVRRADVLIESFAPGVTADLGIDDATLRALNPRLVYCSITGYGDNGRHADRPVHDALVAARTGHQWESRGVPGGTLARLAGDPGFLPDLEVPDDCWVAAPRKGPLFSGVPWVSVATCYLATLAISAALRVRETTGRGQRVSTSMLQGVLATTLGPWQRAERVNAENYQSWVIDPRAPKAVFRCADGRWVHQWTPLPSFVLGVSEGDTLELTDETKSPRESATRIGIASEEMLLLHHYQPLMAAAFAKFPAAPWVELAASVGVPLQPIRSPEEALADPLFVADGCVIEVTDPALGPVRQVGRVYELHACPTDAPAAPPSPGAHTAEVRAEADAATGDAPAAAVDETPAPGSPLVGVRVLDLGLAVAGPWGTMMLADLGADVIKVNALHDGYWMSSHIAMSCNRGKRSIALNLKDPEAMAVLHRLVEQADVVQHNMRYDAAIRLGVDYESLRAIKPDLIYCHTRGFEHGPREGLPGNDQTGAALAGADWLDGALDHDGIPFWPVVSLGDTGNGFLSAIAIVQALYHRDRTGVGQFVDTSIMYAQLLNTSMAWATADGTTTGPRPSLDTLQLGVHALYRLYETADGWLCIAARDDDHRAALAAALGVDVAPDPPFASLEPVFATRAAAEWFDLLDAAGVPCEVSTADFVLGLFDDPEMIEKGWVTSYQHPVVGKLDMLGLLFDFSETPGRIQGPPLVPGQDTRSILRELGYDDEQVDKLIATGVAACPA